MTTLLAVDDEPIVLHVPTRYLERDGHRVVMAGTGDDARTKIETAALVRDGIPFTSFAVDDVEQEFERLAALGVQFTREPTQMGPVTTAVFADTCGNLSEIHTAA